MTPVESVPQIWHDARDNAFFSIVARLFPPTFTAAWTVLLASYDAEPVAQPTSCDDTSSTVGSVSDQRANR